MITTQSTDARVVNELGLSDGCFDETGLSRSCECYWSARSASYYRDRLITTGCDRSCCSFVDRERGRGDAHLTSTSLLLTIVHPPARAETRGEAGRQGPSHSIDRTPHVPPFRSHVIGMAREPRRKARTTRTTLVTTPTVQGISHPGHSLARFNL